jgi:hypothetical protein
MGAALAATARTRRERMAEKRMVVENEGVGRVKEECGIYRRCRERIIRAELIYSLSLCWGQIRSSCDLAEGAAPLFHGNANE